MKFLLKFDQFSLFISFKHLSSLCLFNLDTNKHRKDQRDGHSAKAHHLNKCLQDSESSVTEGLFFFSSFLLSLSTLKVKLGTTWKYISSLWLCFFYRTYFIHLWDFIMDICNNNTHLSVSVAKACKIEYDVYFIVTVFYWDVSELWTKTE